VNAVQGRRIGAEKYCGEKNDQPLIGGGLIRVERRGSRLTLGKSVALPVREGRFQSANAQIAHIRIVFGTGKRRKESV